MVAETAIAINGQPRDIAAIDLTAVERVIVAGDLSKLTPEERKDYYFGVCQSVGLNPYTKPFEYIVLNNKLTLYALKGAADQLRRLYGISITDTRTQLQDGLVIVTVTGTDARGRVDSEIGAVVLPSGGEARANALMKALTKAKRRLTLSMCGLGMLDDSEVDSIPGAQRVSIDDSHTDNGQPENEQERGRIVDLSLTCADCKKPVKGVRFANGTAMQADEVAAKSKERFDRALCMACSKTAAERAEQQDDEAL